MNRDIYNKIFIKIFQISKDELSGLKYQSIPAWDSVGHMELLTEIESAFNISLEMDDIIELNSFEKGMEILKKYGIEF